MRKIALFVEDYGHQQIIGALVSRFARELDIPIYLDWRNARRGHGAVVREFKEYLRDLRRQSDQSPDLIIVATDANCKGLSERARELDQPDAPAPIVLAVPDPHVERWLLLDGGAFKAVFGTGCNAPDMKCSRGRYKDCLVRAIYETGITPTLGGIEFAEDIVKQMDIHRASQLDTSFKRFVDDLHSIFNGWSFPGAG